MTELLDKAFNRVRSLSHETQDELARVLLRLAGDEDAVYLVSDEENADLATAEDEVKRGELATDAEVERVFGTPVRITLREKVNPFAHKRRRPN